MLFRSLRSVRSRIHRENIAEASVAMTGAHPAKNVDASTVLVGAAATFAQPMTGQAESCENHNADRPLKRMGARGMLSGAPRQRMSRTKSTAEQVLAPRASENAPAFGGNAPGFAHAPPVAAPVGVLSDVTNTNRQLQSRSTDTAGITAVCLKPVGPGLALEFEADMLHAEDPQHVVEYLPDISALAAGWLQLQRWQQRRSTLSVHYEP